MYLSRMSTSHTKPKRKPVVPAPKLAIPTQTTIDWSSIVIGLSYEFFLGNDFSDWDVMRNRAHNAARRLGLKATTKRDTSLGVLKVVFTNPQQTVSRKRTK